MLRTRAAILAAAMATMGCATEPASGPEDAPPVPIATRTPKPPATDGPRTVPQGSFTGRSAACGDVFAYRASEDGTQIFGVTFNHPKSEQVIDLGTAPNDVLVTVDVFAEQAANLSCEMLAGPDGPKTTWVAEAGRLETVVGDREVAFMLEDVHLVGPEKGFAVVVPHVFIGTHR